MKHFQLSNMKQTMTFLAISFFYVIHPYLKWDLYCFQVGDNGVSYNSPFTYEKKSKDYSYFVDMEDARETYEPEKVFQ